jgi:pilus assembly protein CpaC
MSNNTRDRIKGVKGRMLLALLSGWTAVFVCYMTPSVSMAVEREIGTAMREVSSSRAFEVPLYKSRILDVDKPVKKLSVGNPEIADILILRANQVYVVGKSLGTTNVVLWDKSNRIIATIDIEITHDTDTLKAKLHELLPNEPIEVYTSQGAIVLSGEVSSPAKIDAALALATSFAPQDEEGNVKAGKVVNLMHVGGVQQVMLEVKVAEINRQVFKQLGIDWNAAYFNNDLIIGGVSGGLLGSGTGNFNPLPQVIDDKGFFSSLLNNHFFFSATINAAKNNGLAKILAEPTLTTLSGQEATFLSGGEFPIPVPNGNNNQVTIEFKDFGIGMGFLPVVLGQDRINLAVDITVSDLTTANSVILGFDKDITQTQYFVPSLNVRKATSSVEIADGQTIAIAGLTSENLRENVDKFPGLGDVPGLGVLFSSKEWQNKESELVIFVTPHLAQPTPRELVRLPTESFIEPSEVGFYLLGSMEGNPPNNEPASDLEVTPSSKGGLEGSFGHQL